MGFVLHDRGGGFVMDANHPNRLAPRKRPFHTIIPGFMERSGQHIGFGIMRGMNQAQAQAQFVSNIVDHGMNIQLACLSTISALDSFESLSQRLFGDPVKPWSGQVSGEGGILRPEGG